MSRRILLFYLLVVVVLSGCKKNNDIVSYHKFSNRTWERFDILKFDIPIVKSGKSWDIYFFANHTKEYEFDNLKFNMVMTTPSGEERIKEYLFVIKDKTSGFLSNCTHDSCSISIALKKGLLIEKRGILRIEIETLVPRLEIKELLGVGIRMVPSGPPKHN
jgi:gliding motility-associated lipoprotein GldH